MDNNETDIWNIVGIIVTLFAIVLNVSICIPIAFPLFYAKLCPRSPPDTSLERYQKEIQRYQQTNYFVHKYLPPWCKSILESDMDAGTYPFPSVNVPTGTTSSNVSVLSSSTIEPTVTSSSSSSAVGGVMTTVTTASVSKRKKALSSTLSITDPEYLLWKYYQDRKALEDIGYINRILQPPPSVALSSESSTKKSTPTTPQRILNPFSTVMMMSKQKSFSSPIKSQPSILSSSVPDSSPLRTDAIGFYTSPKGPTTTLITNTGGLSMRNISSSSSTTSTTIPTGLTSVSSVSSIDNIPANIPLPPISSSSSVFLPLTHLPPPPPLPPSSTVSTTTIEPIVIPNVQIISNPLILLSNPSTNINNTDHLSSSSSLSTMDSSFIPSSNSLASSTTTMVPTATNPLHTMVSIPPIDNSTITFPSIIPSTMDNVLDPSSSAAAASSVTLLSSPLPSMAVSISSSSFSTTFPTTVTTPLPVPPTSIPVSHPSFLSVIPHRPVPKVHFTDEQAAILVQRVYRGSKLRQVLKEWRIIHDDDGDVFYHNQRTNECEWNLPILPFESHQARKLTFPAHIQNNLSQLPRSRAGTSSVGVSQGKNDLTTTISTANNSSSSTGGLTILSSNDNYSSDSKPLAIGWRRVTDGTDTWYFNVTTQESVWEPPFA